MKNHAAPAFLPQLEQTTQSLRPSNESGRNGITEDAVKLANDASQFFLSQQNAHNMLNTHIYHQLPPKCFGDCYTIFRKTTALLAVKLYIFLLCCYIGCAIKCKIYPVFEIFIAVTMFKTIFISSFCILNILKMLVKPLNCSTLISIGSCFLLRMLAKCVFTVSSCAWVRNAVEVLRGPRSCCYVVETTYNVELNDPYPSPNII